MSSITSIFRYKPLDPVQPDAIRVLEIVPGDDAATVECSLYTTTLSDLSGNYRAVSYAWGDVTERCIIKVNGFSLSITPNLNSVLRSFRAGEQQGKFWIDAICINQLDLDERSQQVQQMKEIYTEAREVWVWLGSGHPSRPLEASFLMSLAVRARQIGLLTPNLATMFSFPLCDFEPLIQEFTGESFHSQWRAVADLFAQPWWGRTWVIQELSSAKRATLYYGDVPIDLSAIILIIQMLRTCHTRLLEVDSINDLLRDKADAISGARELIFMWHIVNYSTRATLHSLLRLSRKTSCQDPRDKVFAVLGIAPAEVRMLYKPNYKESTIWVYGMAIMMYIHCHANLDILLNVDDGTSNAGLPSWIVDWNRKHQAQYFDYSGLSFRAGHHTTPVVAVPDGMRILNVEGFHIDIISETGVQGIELQGAERTNVSHYNLIALFKPIFWKTWRAATWLCQMGTMQRRSEVESLNIGSGSGFSHFSFLVSNTLTQYCTLLAAL